MGEITQDRRLVEVDVVLNVKSFSSFILFQVD